MSKPRLLLSWSSGKDSAWALHNLRESGDYEIAGLVTTVTKNFSRVAMHGVRDELVAAQADAAGLPLWRVELPYPCSNGEYERIMGELIRRALADDITYMAFGDLYLEDIRAYRERLLKSTGIKPVFPLWGLNTRLLARDMLASGVRASLTCVDPRRVPQSYAGRSYDGTLLSELPDHVDPCGENGEFHTFCHDGPMFSHPIPVMAGEVMERDGFVFADLRRPG